MTAIVHDAAFERGGGMRVVEHAAEVLDADLYVGMVSDEVQKRSPVEITPLFDKEIHNGTVRGIYFLKEFANVEELKSHDLIIQSGSGTHWYVPEPNQTIIRYVHSVPLSYKRKGILAKISRVLREDTIRYADAYISNSEDTRKEVQTYFDRDSEVIYPPTNISDFESMSGEGYVTISRLTKGKGVHELVEKFNQLGTQLTVIGDGPELESLREKAKSNVDVMGWVSEKQKRDLLRNAETFILNSGNESFGIAPIEALASGCPVVAKNGGYTPHQIDDKKTGILYHDLSEGISRYESGGVKCNENVLLSEAKKYSLEKFTENLNTVIKNVE